jgi:hypothetical protein
MTDYKKYALGQVENFLYDAMSAEATPQEIYDVIRGVVEDNYYTYKQQTTNAYELLALLNGNGKGHLTCDKDDTSEECKESWSNFWEEPSMPPWGHSDLEYAIHYSDKELDEMCAAAELEQDLRNVGDFLKQDRNSNFPNENTVKDRVKKWVLPVEYIDDECFISFPEDLLEAANLKEGDQIEWIDQGDGSCILKKVEVKN